MIASKPQIVPSLRDALAVVAVVLTFRLLVLFLGQFSVMFADSWVMNLELAWTRFDARHYLRLAESLYAAEGIPKNVHRFVSNFPPLYPLLVRGLNQILDVGNFYSGVVVSLLGASIASVLLWRLTLRHFECKRSAWGAVIFFHAFPSAFFLSIPYAEAGYLAFTLWAFHKLEQQELAQTWIGVAAALGTRTVGAVLVPLFFVASAKRTSMLRSVGYLVLPLISLVIYGSLIQYYYGDWFYFWGKDKPGGQSFSHRIPFFPVIYSLGVVKKVFASMIKGDFNSDFLLAYGLNELSWWIALGGCFAVYRKLGMLYFTYCFLQLLLFFALQGHVSIMRYLLTLFPFWMILGRYILRPLGLLVLLVFLGLQFYCASFFVRGEWAF